MQQYGGPGGSHSNPNDGYNTVASAAANANANANYNANRGANSNVYANANSNAVSSYTGASPANYYSPGYDLSDTGANANTNLKSNDANNGAGTLNVYYTAPESFRGSNEAATASANANSVISGTGSSDNYHAPGGSWSNGGAIANANAKTNVIDGVTSGYKPGIMKSDSVGRQFELNGGVELPNGYYSSGTRGNAVTGSKIPYRPHDDEETVVVIVDPPPVHRPALGRPAFGKRPPFGNPPPFGRLPPFGKPSPPFGRPSFERYPQRDHGPEAIKVIVIKEPAYHSQGELPRTDVGLLICTCD